MLSNSDPASIPDPFVGRNELAVEWVGERDWAYQVSFDTPDYRSNEEVDIVFEGLDTISEVFLNSSCILKTGNMFIKHRVSIRDFLRHDRKNVLEIVFKSALQKGRDLEKEHAGHKFIALNGEAGRLAVRKAQYNWVRYSGILRYGLIVARGGTGVPFS